MARYWVGGTGTWDNASTTNWASSDGGASGAGVPDATQDVFFTALSGAGTVTINTTTPLCRSLQTTGSSVASCTHSAATAITVGDGTAGAGNIAVDISGFTTYTLGNATTSSWSLVSTNGTTQTVNWNAKPVGNVTLNATGGSYQLAANVTNSTNNQQFTFTTGAIDTNGKTVTWGIMAGSNSNTRSMTLGASTITISGTGTPWNLATVTGLTFSASSSTINFTAASPTFAGGGLVYGLVTFAGIATPSITGANTYSTGLTIGGAANTGSIMSIAANQGGGTLTLNSNSLANRLMIASSVAGTARTLTFTTLTCANVINFRDITGAGAATWSTAASGATYFGNALGNSGITFTTPATQTATGTASLTWSTHGFTTRVPLPQDDVIVNNAFIAGRTITMDEPDSGANIDFSGCTGSPGVTMSVANSVYGNFAFATGMTHNAGSGLLLRGRGVHTLTMASVAFKESIQTFAVGGSYELQDDLNISTAGKTIVHNNGGFDANDHNITVGSFTSSNSNIRSITMGAGLWSLTSTGTVWSTGTATNLTFNSDTSTITATDVSATGKTLSFGGNPTLYNMTFPTSTAGVSGVIALAGAYTFAGKLTLNPGVSITRNSTTFFNVAPNLYGVPGNPWSLASSAAGVARTWSGTSLGVLGYDYGVIQDSAATGIGTTWYAGANSTNVSGNTGWIFTPAVYARRLKVNFRLTV